MKKAVKKITAFKMLGIHMSFVIFCKFVQNNGNNGPKDDKDKANCIAVAQNYVRNHGSYVGNHTHCTKDRL